MHLSRRPSLVLAARGFLVLALVAVTIAVAHLHLARDRAVTASDIPVPAADNCVPRCNETFVRLLQEEYTRHKKVVREECGGNFVCHKDENYLHQTRLQEIVASHRACKNGCNPVGTSTAGMVGVSSQR